MSKYTYKNKLIQNIVHKPLLHKKGKEWIVLGLSALVLLGLGSIGTVNADTVNSSISNPIRTSIQAKSLQNNSNSNSTSNGQDSQFTTSTNTTTQKQAFNSNTSNLSTIFNIQKRANDLHYKIINNQNNHKVMQSNFIGNSSSNNQAKCNQNDKVISTKFVGDSNSHITANGKFSVVQFLNMTDTSNPFDKGETYSDVVKRGSDVGSHFLPTTNSINKAQAQSILNGQVGNDYNYTVLFPGDKIGDTTVPNYSPKVVNGENWILLLTEPNITYNLYFAANNNTVASKTYYAPKFNPSYLLNNLDKDINNGKSMSDIVDEIPNNNLLKQKLNA